MALTRTPRDAWITQGLRALASGGPEAVRVEALASALKVSKGGFYWHFSDRKALLTEMLDTWERVAIDEVIARVDNEEGDARARLRRLFELAVAGGAPLLEIDLAIRSWARSDATVAQRLKRVDNRRMAFMRSLFGAFCPDPDEVEYRCTVAFSLFIGSHFMAADHGSRSRRDVLELALRRLEA